MRILVTGQYGYTGARLIPILMADGYHCVGLDSGLFAQRTFGEE